MIRVLLRAPVRVLRRVREVWRRIRAWRRISFTSGGAAFTLGSFAVGFAAMNTGNNLLYLLLGAMLGFIVVSGWLSEQAIRGLRVERKIPRAVTVGQELRLAYRVHNAKPRLPSLAVEIAEEGLPGRAFVAHVKAGASARTRSVNSFVRRGIYPLGTVTLSTAFPFGMFTKARDLSLPGEVTVWPRTDRPVDGVDPAGGRGRTGQSTQGSLGSRGEYRNLRGYRPGDDPKDIHWRSSARLREPVIRQYERDGAETCWICLDTRAGPGDAAEVAVEVAASLAASALRSQRPFALVVEGSVVEPREGAGHLERVLDALARVEFGRDRPPPTPPVDHASCILVSVDRTEGFGRAVAVGRGARLGRPGTVEAA